MSFLGGLTRKASLGVIGATLASGGVVSLAHSTPDILKGVGAICKSSEFKKVEGKKLMSGHQYVGDVDKGVFIDTTSQARQVGEDGFC